MSPTSNRSSSSGAFPLLARRSRSRQPPLRPAITMGDVDVPTAACPVASSGGPLLPGSERAAIRDVARQMLMVGVVCVLGTISRTLSATLACDLPERLLVAVALGLMLGVLPGPPFPKTP